MRRMALAVCCLVALAGCTGDPTAPDRHPTATPEALEAHGETFARQVIEVTDGIHVAVGFGIANSIMIEGDDGVIIVDTLESLEAGAVVAERFRAITDAPVRALIYTHSHPDHIMGAGAFVDADDAVTIYAHDTLTREADLIAGVLQPIITHRSLHMYGNLLEEEERSNVGIGPFIDLDGDTTVQMLRPTHTFSDRLEAEIAGVRLELVHAPGETDDQIVVWLPDHATLVSGDNFYRSFPNLYTLRGTSFRDPRPWADSLDMMRQLEPEHLVPGHGEPLSGAEEVARHLTDYRDAIRYVNDQTIRMMNAGLTPDELAHRIELPPHLAASPYLQPFYGTPEWSARSIYQGHLGWFDSNPTNLRPAPPAERAQRLLELAGGRDELLAAAQNAVTVGDHQWALELTDHLLVVDGDDQAAIDVRIHALRALAEQESNPNARHYYLTHAGELAGELSVPFQSVSPNEEMLASIPMPVYFDAMSVALDGQAAWDVHQKVSFEFPDLGETYTLIVRRGVTELIDGIAGDADIHVQVDSLVFKQLLTGQRSPVVTLARDVRFVEGGRIGLARFLRLFDAEVALPD